MSEELKKFEELMSQQTEDLSAARVILAECEGLQEGETCDVLSSFAEKIAARLVERGVKLRQASKFLEQALEEKEAMLQAKMDALIEGEEK